MAVVAVTVTVAMPMMAMAAVVVAVAVPPAAGEERLIARRQIVGLIRAAARSNESERRE
jgi:hypothetical protein